MGIEPTKIGYLLARVKLPICGDVSQTSFFAASFPFFLFQGSFARRVCLAGNKYEKSRFGTVKMPSMRLSQAMEKRCAIHVLGRSTALFMSRLRISVFRQLTALRHHNLSFPFFSLMTCKVFDINRVESQ
jgi:hypothetical protein